MSAGAWARAHKSSVSSRHLVSAPDAPRALCGFKPTHGWDPDESRITLWFPPCPRCKARAASAKTQPAAEVAGGAA